MSAKAVIRCDARGCTNTVDTSLLGRTSNLGGARSDVSYLGWGTVQKFIASRKRVLDVCPTHNGSRPADHRPFETPFFF